MQSYWQSAVAAKPSSTYTGYILGGLCWFCIPFTLATSLGLASRALALPISLDEANAGTLCHIQSIWSHMRHPLCLNADPATPNKILHMHATYWFEHVHVLCDYQPFNFSRRFNTDRRYVPAVHFAAVPFTADRCSSEYHLCHAMKIQMGTV